MRRRFFWLIHQGIDLHLAEYLSLKALMERELKLDFQKVERNNPHESLKKILTDPPKKWEKLGDMVVFPQGTETSDWPLR